MRGPGEYPLWLTDILTGKAMGITVNLEPADIEPSGNEDDEYVADRLDYMLTGKLV